MSRPCQEKSNSFSFAMIRQFSNLSYYAVFNVKMMKRVNLIAIWKVFAPDTVSLSRSRHSGEHLASPIPSDDSFFERFRAIVPRVWSSRAFTN